MDQTLLQALQTLDRLDARSGERARSRLTRAPTDPDAISELAECLVQNEQGDAAVQVWSFALSLSPGHARSWDGLGTLFEQVDALEDALGCMQEALGVEPTALRHFRLGCVLQRLGRRAAAIEQYRQALSRDPNLQAAHHNLAGLLVVGGQAAAAVEHYRRVVALDPKHSRAWCNLGAVLRDLQDLDGSIEALERAVDVDPDYVLALANLAGARESRHDIAGARTALDRALALDPSEPLANLVGARMARRDGALDLARERAQRAAHSPSRPELRGSALIELGIACDRLGETEAAFQAWSTGQLSLGQRGAAATLSRSAWPDRVDRIAEQTESLLALEPARSREAQAPLFMLAFPRSGTTLLDQVLDSHPGLSTAEERAYLDRALASTRYPADASAVDVEAVRRNYMEASGDWAPAGVRRVDKLPLNLIHAALISRAFPDSKLIVNLRDPRDVCLSCFIQDFVPNEAMVHFCDLKSTAELYARVMGLWLSVRERLDVPVFEIRYEDLVEDLEGSVRKLLDFLELPWDPALLRYYEHASQRASITPSHQDVTKPIFTRSRGRWRRYEAQMAPVASILAPFVEAFGYEA